MPFRVHLVDDIFDRRVSQTCGHWGLPVTLCSEPPQMAGVVVHQNRQLVCVGNEFSAEEVTLRSAFRTYELLRMHEHPIRSRRE